MNVKMKEFDRICSKLESDMETTKKMSKRYKHFYNALHSVAVRSQL